LIWYTGNDPVESELLKGRPVTITFQGGLGAQIISASIYFYLRKHGYKIYADLSYFKNKSYLAIVGEGRCSQWDYRLEVYGLHMSDFENINNCAEEMSMTIADGALKAVLYQKAIADPEIKKYFPISQNKEILEAINFFRLHSMEPHSYICMHVRRGDYMNSDIHHIISENNFLKIAEKFVKQYSTIVVASDSKLSAEFKYEIGKKFTRTVFLDDMAIDDFATHTIMRLASILICSNSQFSMTAGSLSEGLAFIPTRFFEGGHQKDLAKVIYEKFTNFSLLN
jgi:hypothetical protein